MTKRILSLTALVFILTLALGCASEEQTDDNSGNEAGKARATAVREYEEGVRKQTTAENMKSFQSLGYYEEALLCLDAAIRKAPDAWEQEDEARERLSALSKKVKRIRAWKKTLEKVRADASKVRKAPSLREDLVEQCEEIMEEADVPFVKAEAARCLDTVRKAFAVVANRRLDEYRGRAFKHLASGMYAKALDELSEFPSEYAEEVPALQGRLRSLRKEIDLIAREDYETLVERRVDYLVGKKRFKGASYVLRKARVRFVGFNKILDRLEALQDEVEDKMQAHARAEAKSPAPKPKPKPKPLPVPKPRPKPAPKPAPKPSNGSKSGEEATPGPYGAMGGAMTEVTNPMGKARKALALAKKYDRASQPGASNYDKNLALAVKHYRRAQELYEVCQDNGIGNRNQNEEILTEINQSLFWCQKRRRLGK